MKKIDIILHIFKIAGRVIKKRLGWDQPLVFEAHKDSSNKNSSAIRAKFTIWKNSEKNRMKKNFSINENLLQLLLLLLQVVFSSLPPFFCKIYFCVLKPCFFETLKVFNMSLIKKKKRIPKKINCLVTKCIYDMSG